LPQGGFGNLIALPLQKQPRERGNIVFLNDRFEPHHDQWAFLASVEKLSGSRIEALVSEAEHRRQTVGVRLPFVEEDELQPWTALPSRRPTRARIIGDLPCSLELVLGKPDLHR
jgi:hypothetical protein